MSLVYAFALRSILFLRYARKQPRLRHERTVIRCAFSACSPTEDHALKMSHPFFNDDRYGGALAFAG